MKYNTILFDADMTLFNFKAAESIALEQALNVHNYPCNEEVKALYGEINDGLWKAFERGEISREALTVERFARLFRQLGIDDDGAAFNQEYLSNLGEIPLLLDGAAELCRALAKKYRLYIITNGVTRTQRNRFAKSEIKDCFAGVFVSEETGSQKPHRAYFDYVAAKIPDWDPKTTLVVGDSLTSDIQGAINYGLDSCWFNPDGMDYTLETACTFEIRQLSQLLDILS